MTEINIDASPLAVEFNGGFLKDLMTKHRLSWYRMVIAFQHDLITVRALKGLLQ